MSENLPHDQSATDPSLLAGNTTTLQEAPYRLIQNGKVYDELKDGQAVNIAAFGNIFVEIDEENLGLDKVSLESLQKGWEAQGESFTKGLQERGVETDPFTVFKWYQIQRKVFNTLGTPNINAGERNRRFIEQNDRVKLSETKGFAMCSEYAILSALIAQKIGEPAHVVIGTAAGAAVKEIVDQFINPLVGFILGGADLAKLTWNTGLSRGGEDLVFGWGAILGAIITLLATAFVVYQLVHIAKLDRLDKKKD